jgi:hypothetical protein
MRTDAEATESNKTEIAVVNTRENNTEMFLRSKTVLWKNYKTSRQKM